MRAVVLEGPRRASVQQLPRPEPEAGEVLVRLEGTGVCGSDLPDWQGRPWTSYPLDPGRPGHEGWGVVTSAGAGVAGVAEGDRVAGLFGNALAEYDTVPADTLVPLPDDGRPWPLEPVACAVNAFERARIEAGDTVAVVGAGFLGVVLTRLAADRGAIVVAINRRSTGLDAARDQGAKHTLPYEGPDQVVEAVEAWTDGALCDVVLECTGAQGPLDVAARVTRTRGRLVVVGYHQEPRQVDMQLWNWRGLDVVNAHERDRARYTEGMRRGLTLVREGRLDLHPLLTHAFDLEEAPEALDHLEQRPSGFLKGVVRWWDGL